MFCLIWSGCCGGWVDLFWLLVGGLFRSLKSAINYYVVWLVCECLGWVGCFVFCDLIDFDFVGLVGCFVRWVFMMICLFECLFLLWWLLRVLVAGLFCGSRWVGALMGCLVVFGVLGLVVVVFVLFWWMLLFV